MPTFETSSLSVMIDLCGIYIVNITNKSKQFCGHLAFKKSIYDLYDMPNCDSLFDELAFEKPFRDNKLSIGFIKDIQLEAVQKISFKKFMEQRVRYAYENFAFPHRFALHLSIIPLLVIITMFNVRYMVGFICSLNISLVILGLIGQMMYKSKNSPKYTFLLSPIWFWFYPFTSWIAVSLFITGGVTFGGRKVRKA